MPTHSGSAPGPLTLYLGAVLALAACSPETPAGTTTGELDLPALQSDRVSVCHAQDARSRILEVGLPALADHLAHGDYVTTLLVSHAGLPANGVNFGRITDALAAARSGRLARGELVTAACRITIVVSAETYQGTAGVASGAVEQFPLVFDVPQITLRGALVMGLDGTGRATGTGTGDEETTLTPVEPLPFVGGLSTPIVVANAHPGGSAGNGLIVTGFVFQSGHNPAVDAGGQGVLSVRTTDLTVKGNRFEGGFTESIDIRSGAVAVVENHLLGGAGTCDICLAGPGSFVATGNRLGTGGIPGIIVAGMVNLPLPAGVEPYDLPATAETWAVVRNNEVHDHLRLPVGSGIRVDGLGIGAPNVHNTVHADIRDNLLVNNRFGMIVHAGFVVANTGRRSDVDVSISGNVFQQSCQANMLVSLARHTTALGISNTLYLLNSTFSLSLNGNLDWNDVWYGHPAGFGNTLIVDGNTIDNGIRQFYDAAGCPNL